MGLGDSFDGDISENDAGKLAQLLTGAVSVEGVADFWDAEAIEALIRRCIRKLPPRQREYLLLDLVERMPRAEIAKEIGLPSKSLAALKAKALRALRDEVLKDLKKGPRGGLL